mgnify:CR=1 FL=1
METEEIIIEIRKQFEKGQTNPSACAAIMFYKGAKGRFGEIRKIAEYQYKLYSMEVSRKK